MSWPARAAASAAGRTSRAPSARRRLSPAQNFRAFGTLLGLSLLLLGACSNQAYRPQLWTLEARTPAGEGEEPAPTRPLVDPAPLPDDRIQLQIDGRAVDPIALRPIPYHGQIELQASVDDPELALDYTESRRVYAMPEPVSPWLFPLDFVIEITRGALGGLPPRRASIGPVPRRLGLDRSGEVDERTTLERLSARADRARARRTVSQPLVPQALDGTSPAAADQEPASER